jgi:spore germination protein (amino acid permease)
MIADEKISQRQCLYFILSTGFGTIIFLHTAVISLSGRSGWLAEVAGTLSIIPLGFWTLYLSNAFPGHTVFGLLDAAIGKVIGSIVKTLYILVNVGVVALLGREMSSVVKVFLLPTTPLWVINLLGFSLVTFIVYGGLEPLGRLSETLHIVLLTIFFVGVGIGFSVRFDKNNLIPLFDRSLGEFVAGAYLTAGFVAETVLILLVVVAALPSPSKSYSAIAKGFISLAVFLAGAVLAILGVFGPEEGMRMAYAGINVASNAQLGTFLQGLEVFAIVSFIMAVILKVSAHTYAGWTVAVSLFGKWCPALWLVVLSGVTFLVSSNIPSFNLAYYFSLILGKYVTLPFVVFILLLVTLSILFRGGKVVQDRL